MKNKEKTKPTKKRILFYYMVMAACLLVIAAVAVGVVFAVRNNNPTNPTLDTKPDDGNKPNEPNNPNEPDNPVDTSTSYVFIAPITEVSLSQAHVFGYDKTLDRYCLHEGMDFSAKAGTNVLAAVDGTVTEVSTSDVLYGAVVKISHANGVETVYRFIEPAANLKKGDKVNRGDVIGSVATATGVENAVGDHLHFEVYKDSKIQDPDDYLDIESK